MGCNIHGWIEIKSKYLKDYWDAQACEPMYDRHYPLFAWLANIRNYNKSITPLTTPRGLPKNVSERAQEDSDKWDVDGHSHSWVSAEELLSLPAIVHFNDVWVDWLKIFRSYVHIYGKENVRFVFWFDN